MPNYIFQHPDTGEYEEVFFHMNDEPKEYRDEEGVEWTRIFGSPQISTAGSFDPWNKQDFVEKTKNMKGTYGDLLDKSSELSERRAERNGGIDPVKQKAYDQYAKARGGQKHPQEIREKSIDSKNVKIEF
jgi:predicted nucleic acid-binding Zn ribbon protein